MKKMKRLLAVLLSLLFMFSAVQAASALVIANGTCGRDCTWSLDNFGNLTIKGSGNIDSYTVANQSFRTHASNIMNVIIKGSVAGIGSQAFQKMNELKSVTISSTMEVINQSAFSSCPSLTKVTLPEGLLTLGNKVFEGCKSLPEITVPSSVTSLGTGLFLKCDALQTITVLSKTAIFPKALFAPKTTAIKGYVGSTAEKYANAYGLAFIVLENSAPTQPTGETTTAASQTTTAAAAQGGEPCPLCGQIHAGFPDSILGFLHKAIYVVVKLFGI